MQLAELLSWPWTGRTGPANTAGTGRRGPIGVELGHQALHLVQFEQAAQGPRIAAFGSVPLSDGGDALLAGHDMHRAALRRALRAGGFRGRRAVACAPRTITRLWLTNVRADGEESEAQAVARQVMERIDDDPQGWSVDYVPVRGEGKPGEARTALVAMVRRDPQWCYLDALRAAGLHAEAMEIGPVAIRRLVAAVPEEQQVEGVLVVNFAEKAAFLTVISGRRLLLDREFALGEEQLLSELATTLDTEPEEAARLVARYGISPADAGSGAAIADAGLEIDFARTAADILKPAMLQLAEEIERVRFFTASQTHGSSIDRIYLLGSVARWPGAATLLADVLPYQVQTLDPLRLFPGADDETVGEPASAGTRFAVAAGCALRSPAP